MENKNKHLIITFILVALVIITGTFAWLSYRSKKTSLVFTVGDMNNMQVTLFTYQIDAELAPSLTYDDTEGYISVDAINNSSTDKNFQLYFKIEYSSSELLSEDLKYTVLKSIDGGSTYTEYDKGIGNFSTANTWQNFVILDEIVPTITTYKYKVCIWLSDNGEEQNGLENTRFNADLKAIISGPYADLKNLNNANFYRENAYKTKITDIHFIYDKDLPNGITTNNVKTYDLGANESKPVTGYLIRNTDEGAAADTYKLYISSEYEITPTNLSGAFNGMTSVNTITFDNLNTSETTTMESMFYATKIISIDLSSFDTSKVINMKDMFNGCSSLTELNLSNFDTSSVINMEKMFYSCNGLIELNLSNFNTSNVTNMSNMFRYCSNLISLDLSNFNTSNVIYMQYLFDSCASLTTINLSTFDTSKVNNMLRMFYNCSSLTSLNLSNFNTSNVTNMSSMFYGCSNLTTIDLSSFNTSNVTNMSSMFSGCSNLTTLDLSSFNTSSVTNMSGIFGNCNGLTSLNLSSFNTSIVTNMKNMFSGCSNLTALVLSSFNTSSVTDMSSMFSGCNSLTSLNLSNFNTSSVTNMSSMFYGCSNLTTIDLSSFNTSSVTDMFSMFSGCSNLTTIDLSSFNTSSVTSMYKMFDNCKGLTSLDLSSFETSKVADSRYMFSTCSNLEYIYVSDRWNMSNSTVLTNSIYMFNNDKKLPNFNSSVVDKTNAHYGTGGYLTYKAYTPPSNS